MIERLHTLAAEARRRGYPVLEHRALTEIAQIHHDKTRVSFSVSFFRWLRSIATSLNLQGLGSK